MENTTKASPHVVVVGGGFGGIRVALGLAQKGVKITLVDRYNYHLFQPLLYQVATAGLSVDDIAYPIRAIVKDQKNIDFRLAEVTGVDFESKSVTMSKGAIGYDYLVLAGIIPTGPTGHRNTMILKSKNPRY